MKIAAAIVVFVLTFFVMMVGMLYLTGNLNSESLARLWGGEREAVAPVPPVAGDVDPLITALREKEKELRQREAELEEEEERLALMRQELESLRKNLDDALEKVNKTLNGADEAQEKRLATVAQSIASMEAENAAETLTSDMFTPEEAALILERIEEERVRGNILNEMEPQKAALVLQALKKSRYGT